MICACPEVMHHMGRKHHTGSINLFRISMRAPSPTVRRWRPSFTTSNDVKIQLHIWSHKWSFKNTHNVITTRHTGSTKMCPSVNSFLKSPTLSPCPMWMPCSCGVFALCYSTTHSCLRDRACMPPSGVHSHGSKNRDPSYENFWMHGRTMKNWFWLPTSPSTWPRFLTRWPTFSLLHVGRAFR